jgi:hypothetical protein
LFLALKEDDLKMECDLNPAKTIKIHAYPVMWLTSYKELGGPIGSYKVTLVFPWKYHLPALVLYVVFLMIQIGINIKKNSLCMFDFILEGCKIWF